MSDVISAREANQHFSRLLREVESGEEFVVTRNGKPVARILPIEAEVSRLSPEQEKALRDMKAFLKKGWPLGGRMPNRDDLYDRQS